MTQLAALQKQFMSAIVHGSPEFEQLIESTERVSAAQRISIYSDAYHLRLLEALEDNYPGTAYLLGDQQFESLGRQYIQHHPSSFRSIRWFGDRLPEFVAAQTPWSEIAMLEEMTKVDWTMTLAFDAPDAPVFVMESMAQFAPEQWPMLRFEFHPAVHRLDLAWSVIPFRAAVEAEREKTPAPEQTPYPVAWIIWRQNYRQLFRSMEVDEAWALDQARNGVSFAGICEGITEWIDPEHSAERVVSFLKKWLTDELISNVYVQ